MSAVVFFMSGHLEVNLPRVGGFPKIILHKGGRWENRGFHPKKLGSFKRRPVSTSMAFLIQIRCRIMAVSLVTGAGSPDQDGGPARPSSVSRGEKRGRAVQVEGDDETNLYRTGAIYT